jgi:uncharacterized CHY-type Zn-finger protein
MSMYRHATGHITEYKGASDDGAIICQSCSKIIISAQNLDNGHCPFCHQDVNQAVSDVLIDGDDEDIALPC